MDYLTQEQRYNIAMRLLSIVERMAFGRVADKAPTPPRQADSEEPLDEHEPLLNAMIRQVRAAGPELMMTSPEELTNEQPHDG